MAKDILFTLILAFGIFLCVECAVVSKESGAGRSRRTPPEWLNTVQMASRGSSRYVVRLVKKNWVDASADCQSIGGYLAEMDTQAEWSHVVNQLKRLDPTNNHWLGAKGHGKHGGWRWTRSGAYIPSSPVGVGSWMADEPNNDSETCMISGYSLQINNNWFDGGCLNNQCEFICEFS